MRPYVTIDDHRTLLFNGKPFFPITVRHMPEGATHQMLREIGFNAIRWTPFGMAAFEKQTWEIPEELAGLAFYAYLYNRADLSSDGASRRHELEQLVHAVMGHPAFLCYEQRNEPACSYRDLAKPQSTAEGLIAGSEVIRALDRDHPIRIGHMNTNLVSTLRRYNPAVDIVGCNPYIILAPSMRMIAGMRPDGKVVDCPDQTLSAVGQCTSKMMRVAEGRPVWMQIQGASNENFYHPGHTPETQNQGVYEHHRLYPSRWQMRFMAFNAIIRGATGLEWMLVRHSIDTSAWLDVCKVIGELQSLHDVLASPPWTGRMEVEYTELGFSDWDGVETLVKLHDDKPVILAANTQFDPMIATFSNLPEGASGSLVVLGENRRIQISGGKFTDRFQPYEVHVYSAS
ncbi:MAG: hypothetical protein EXQ58_00475 [Acidobacteria bacterium]|nr:hypothetical protein [Acidobacteriota bacterium]